MPKERKLFCEYGPIPYWISTQKECLKRDIKDLLSKQTFARRQTAAPLPHLVMQHCSVMLRRLAGVDQTLQQNKVNNLRLAAAKINGIIIEPGQTFSLWKLVGNPTKRRGYLPGLTIAKGVLGSSVGGGMCQMANMIHWLVLHSPLTITETHHHSDALFPDDRRRVPFGTGTSIMYKNLDYRFYNGTDAPVQLLVWLDGDELRGQLRSAAPVTDIWRIEEQDHHFAQEQDGAWYRNSRIYRVQLDAAGAEVSRTLMLQNHSRVMYDPALIPPDQIRQ